MTFTSTGAKHKPALDEGSFQQLLAAAYVVQQHNEAVQAEPSPRSQVLAVIAEVQSLIRTQGLNVAAGCTLIGERILTLTGASGVSISLVDNGYLDCVAEAGVPARIPGSSVSSHSTEATKVLKAGHMFQSEDSQTDSRLGMDVCSEVGVGSLVAAPVLRFGDIAGLVEVRWARPHAFGEPELRTCRLMAGLVTGTLERSVRIGNARSGSLQTPERQIQPETISAQAEAIAETPPLLPITVQPVTTVESSDEGETKPVQPGPEFPKESESESKTAFAPSCRMCGRPFAGDEQFCGFCSMPRPAENRTEELQSKWASLYFMQRAQGVLRQNPLPAPEVQNTPEDELRAESIPDLFPKPDVAPVALAEPRPLMWPRRAPLEVEPKTSQVEFVAPEISFPFDERPPLSERTGNFLKRHWRNVILAAVAVALAYGLIMAWPKPGRDTWFHALMVRLGFQHASDKVFAGAPDARVWIDVHTQLYYCSGEDLYGKTPDGEFTTQYNAQSDGFLPASNTTCP